MLVDRRVLGLSSVGPGRFPRFELSLVTGTAVGRSVPESGGVGQSMSMLPFLPLSIVSGFLARNLMLSSEDVFCSTDRSQAMLAGVSSICDRFGADAGWARIVDDGSQLRRRFGRGVVDASIEVVATGSGMMVVASIPILRDRACRVSDRVSRGAMSVRAFEFPGDVSTQISDGTGTVVAVSMTDGTRVCLPSKLFSAAFPNAGIA